MIAGSAIFQGLEENLPSEEAKQVVENTENAFWISISGWQLAELVAVAVGLLLLVFYAFNWLYDEFSGSYGA